MKRDSFPSTEVGSAVNISRERAEDWLRAFLRHEFALTDAALAPDADLYQDLDLDSIDAAEIVLRFNDAFNRDVDAREFRRVRTLAQAIDLLLR